MNTFTIFVLILLMLSIANNLIMYNKCYVSRNIETIDPRLKNHISYSPINIYHTQHDNLTNTLKMLNDYCDKHKKTCFISHGTPNYEDYKKINKLV
jgi:hypothetical protein